MVSGTEPSVELIGGGLKQPLLLSYTESYNLSWKLPTVLSFSLMALVHTHTLRRICHCTRDICLLLITTNTSGFPY